jgi:hypothetical protein
MRQETRIQRIPFDVRKEADGLSLEMAINLGPIIASNRPIEVGIASVMQTQGGKETYWAMLQPRPEADFHERESFVLEFR